jgi:hypothetical protein
VTAKLGDIRNVKTKSEPCQLRSQKEEEVIMLGMETEKR